MLSRIGEYVRHSSIVQMMYHMDVLSFLILGLLLVLSIVCWAIFLYKWYLFTLKKRDLTRITKKINDMTSQEFVELIKDLKVTSSARIMKYVARTVTVSNSANDAPDYRLSQGIEPIIEEILNEDEQYMFILLISSQIAPLLGLLGTIWGLIQAFVNISQKQSADMVGLAPGIAQALITTLAGLLVAIPAHAMYHTLSYKIRDLEQKLYVFSHRCFSVVMPLSF